MPAQRPRNLQEELGKRDAFRAPEQEAYLNLVRTHAVLSREFAELFKQHGISDPQYNALRIIAGAGKGGIRSEAIGARMVAQDPDTTRLLDRLEKAGLISRRRSTDDRRCVFVLLTVPGKRLLERLEAPIMGLHRRQLGRLGRRKLRQLNDLLFEARQ